MISAYTFFLFSRAIEFVGYSLHLMTLIAVPTILVAVVSGKIFRAFLSRIGLSLCLLTGWMVFAMPFSIWKGGSITGFSSGWAKSFLIFLLVSALIENEVQLRRYAFILAWATAAILGIVNMHAVQGAYDRLALGYGTLGNANDLATLFLIGLSFCMYVATDKRRFVVWRIFFLIISVACILMALKTGSRGALVTIILLGGIVFVKAPPAGKVYITVVFILLFGSLPFLLTPELKARYITILDSGDADEAVRNAEDATVVSALQSTEARREMLKHALRISVQHPIFGVGYGQFPVADANRAISEGQPAYWHEVHNVFLLMLAENGVIALVFFGRAWYLAMRVAATTYNRTRKNPVQKETARFSLCLLTALVSSFICNNFATDAYGFQLPLLAAMAVSLERVSAIQSRIELPIPPPLFTPSGALRSRRGRYVSDSRASNDLISRPVHPYRRPSSDKSSV